MDNETSQNSSPIPGLNQSPPPEPKFFLRPKVIILVLVGVLILAGLGAGVYFFPTVTPSESTVVSEVRVIDGVPRIFLNGNEEKNLMIAEVYHYRDNLNVYELPYGEEWVSGIKKIIDSASLIGAKVVSLPVWWNEIDKSTSKPNSITENLDFSYLDEVMDYAESKGMYVTLSPEMHKMIPQWWFEEYDFPPLNLERETSLCIPKEKDAEVSCIPKGMCRTGQPCCNSETTELSCCNLAIEATIFGATSKRLDNGMIKCAKANDEPYKKCDFCETDSFGWKYPFPSKGNGQARADYGEYLGAVIDRYKNHGALFGWQFTLGAMGEDFYGDYTEMFIFGGTLPEQVADYSSFFAREFFKWLKSKYQNNQKLQDAWGDSTADLSNAVIPPPSAFFKNGHPTTLLPDQYGGGFVSEAGLDALSQKGKDFYEFRESMREKDRQYYISLFKEIDPKHLFLYGTVYNDNVLANKKIDGSTGNPNLRGEKFGDKYDVAVYYQEIKQARDSGKTMVYNAENGQGVSTENDNQLKAIERFGKAVKCFGGYFGYVTEIPQKTNGVRYTMPSWDSEGAKKAIRNIFSYSPTVDCANDFISNQAQGKCGDGVCDVEEKSNLCPKDCEEQVFQPTPNTSITPIVPITSDKGTDSPFGIQGFAEELKSNDFKNALKAGVKWIRIDGINAMVWDLVERNKGTYNWDKTDQTASKLFQNGFNIVWMTKSFNRWDQGITQPTGNLKLPKNLNAYANFLSTAAERYDGDGINDAPGSPVVNYWQIENEVDGNFWDDTPQAYASLLKTSYETIKKANSNAKVLISGAGTPKGFYNFHTAALKELANLNDKYFDIMDVHWYESAGDYKEHPIGNYVLVSFMQDLRTKLSSYGYGDADIWFTETGTYSGSHVLDKQGNIKPSQGESVQAAELIKRYIHFTANGVRKVFWHHMGEGSSKGGDNDYFLNVGLIYNGRGSDDLGLNVKKLAYYSYQKMTEILEGSDWNNTQKIQESGNVYIYKFTKNGKPVLVAWNDNNQTKTVNLDVGSVSSVKITEAVPKYESGKDVTDYNTAFTTESKTVQNRQITLTLNDVPVFVE